ncbi:LacI family transcriptional regulator [Friedmanniella endophytica]|uniref:LacI family transcriptional regulator n=1 Tax=Microlunatus kandeliicorticis TaxID=1759536 RepID=A0A7W3IQC4_9ACTN|nr:LacI family transcriptional regulator [Microlunatus kandeliicorticis]
MAAEETAAADGGRRTGDRARGRRRGGTANLATVAASAGVSIATVSKVVNGRSDVGPETRARVQSLLEQHNYVGRRAEPATGTGPRTVELVFHGDQTGYALAILDGVLEAAARAGVSVAVSVRARRDHPVEQPPANVWVRQLVALDRTAVIDVVDDARHGDLAALARSKVPFVLLDPLSLPQREVPSIGTTNFSGALTATQHLIDLGHRRIAHYGGPPEFLFSRARAHGYRAAMEGAGLPVPDGYVGVGSYDHAGGVAGGGALLDRPDRPTAIFAATDESAAGVIEAARLRGLRVPEDLSLVGFDDAPISRLLSPPLTTVRQPLLEMGRVALQTALRLAAGEPLEVHHVELATELIVRASTAPPV